MKLTRKELILIIEKSLLNELTPDLIGHQSYDTAPKVAKDIGKSKTLPKTKNLNDLVYDIQMDMSSYLTGFPGSVLNDLNQPLALRGFARWFSQSGSKFTKEDLTTDELKVMKLLLLVKLTSISQSSKKKFKSALSGKKVYFTYKDYELFPPLTADKSSDPLWSVQNNESNAFYKKNDDKATALNISKFLGQFDIIFTFVKGKKNESGKSIVNATIKDVYDFNYKDPKSGIINQPAKIKGKNAMAPAVFAFNFLFEYLWNWKKSYSSARKAAGASQKLGLRSYPIEIEIKDIYSAIPELTKLAKK